MDAPPKAAKLIELTKVRPAMPTLPASPIVETMVSTRAEPLLPYETRVLMHREGNTLWTFGGVPTEVVENLTGDYKVLYWIDRAKVKTWHSLGT